MSLQFTGAKAEILANFKDQHTALKTHDVEGMRELLSEGFTRTHINGKTITREQWLKQLVSREITYHDFEYDKITIDVDGSTATLIGRVTTDATLYGVRKKWRLQLRQSFMRTGGKWIATRSVGTTW